jgi:hypothetical protein
MAYVYRHIRKDKNEPFYIGIGNSKYDYHRAYERYNRNEIWKRIDAKTDIDVEILIDNITYEKAKEKEVEFVKLYGRINKGTGSLANMTEGGDSISFSGMKHKPETIEKMRASSYKVKRVICRETGRTWNSCREAAEDLKINYTTLRSWLNGNRKNLSTFFYE